jgi:hypothetical protein
LVFGRAAYTPFGTVSKKDRERIGLAIKVQIQVDGKITT